jgi:uncharacterized membrane protein YgdD (TMEM256/DUF423 family)
VRTIFAVPSPHLIGPRKGGLKSTLRSAMKLPELWSAALFLFGLQLGAFGWRLSREISMAERGETTWLPLAEYLNLAAMISLIVAVFVLPIAGYASLRIPRLLLGVSLLLFVGHAFALVGHYKLFTRGRLPDEQEWAPLQERVAVALSLIVAGVLVALVYL